MNKKIFFTSVIISLIYIILIARWLTLGKEINWLSGNPLSDISWFVSISTVTVVLSHFLSSKLLKNIPLKNISLVIWIIIIIPVYLYAIAPTQPLPEIKTKGKALELLRDYYFELVVPNKMRGRTISNERYKIKFKLKNLTSMPVHITKIQAEIFPVVTKTKFTAQNHIPRYLGPNEEKTIELTGNELLPKSVNLEIFHNLSSATSNFTIALTGNIPPKSCPPPLSSNIIEVGMEALEAINQSVPIDVLYDYNLISAFPGNSKTYIDSKNTRLKFIEVESWVVNFCSPKGVIYGGIVDRFNANLKKTNAKCVYVSNLDFPTIGNKEALRIANSKNLICSDWQMPRLLRVKTDENYKYVWFLQYLNKEDDPILINAATGEIIKKSYLKNSKE